MIILREWMKEKRLKCNMTQQFVAEKIGISKQYYQQIESNERQIDLNTSLVMRLSELFKMSPVEIVDLENK